MKAAPEEWDEAGKWLAAVQAAGMLAVFFVLIIFGVDWRFSAKPQSAALTVSLLPVPLSPPPPSPKPKVAPEPKPKPESKPEPEPQKAAPTEAEIALKKEAERKRKEKQQREAEAKKKREKEKKKKEKEKREKKEREEKEREKKEEKKKREEAAEIKKRKEEEEKRKVAEKERLAKEQRRQQEAATRAAVLNNLKDGYINRIIGSIEQYLITPPGAKGKDDLEVVVEVNLDVDGSVTGWPRVLQRSGVPEYDEEAVRAVMKASPLPMPKDPELLDEFRTLKLHISPQ